MMLKPYSTTIIHNCLIKYFTKKKLKPWTDIRVKWAEYIKEHFLIASLAEMWEVVMIFQRIFIRESSGILKLVRMDLGKSKGGE